MEGRIAIVTGGSQGLGRAVAGEIIARGGRVAALARRREPLESARAEFGDRYLPIVADIADSASVAAAYDAVDEAFGLADVLVNVAGLFRSFAIETATDSDFADHLGTNLLGPLNMIRQGVRRMKRLGCGDIVNVSSESVTRPFPFLSLYGATKAALETLTSGLSPELREYDIRCAVFRVGRMLTEGADAHVATAAALATTDPAFIDRYGRIVRDGGYVHDVGQGVRPDLPARALVDMLAQPRGAVTDLTVFRSR